MIGVNSPRLSGVIGRAKGYALELIKNPFRWVGKTRMSDVILDIWPANPRESARNRQNASWKAQKATPGKSVI